MRNRHGAQWAWTRHCACDDTMCMVMRRAVIHIRHASLIELQLEIDAYNEEVRRDLETCTQMIAIIEHTTQRKKTLEETES